MAGIGVIPDPRKLPKSRAFSVVNSENRSYKNHTKKQEVLMPRTMNPKPKSNTKRVTFHLTHDMVKTLEKQADSTGQNVSQIIRRAIDKYMNVDLYKEDTDFLTGTFVHFLTGVDIKAP